MEQNSSGGFDREQLKDVQSWRRSRSDRMLAGVCGGMGRALNVDPVLIRVVMAVLILSGPGIIFYLAAWMLMPGEGTDRSAAQGLLGDKVRIDHPWLWPIVIGTCVFFAIAMMSSFNFGKMVPGPLVVLALLWLFVFRRKGHNWSSWGHRSNGSNGSAPAQTPPPSGPQYSAPTQSGPPSPPADQASPATQRPQDRVTEPVQPVWTEDDPLGLYVDEPPARTATATRTAAAPPVKGVKGLKPAIVLATGVALSVAYLSEASTTTTLTIGLITLGLGMLLGGFVGKTLGLLPLGILLAACIAASTVFPSVPRKFADTNFVATPQSTVGPTNMTHQFDAGTVHLDLTKAVFQPGAKVVVDGGVGDVVVKLPANVDAVGTVLTDTGEVDAFTVKKGGQDAKMTLNDLGADGKIGPASVVLDLHLKLGSIRVERG
ncbi:PspC domain-containing protein [Kribbella sp. NPDC023855]|uniref:PspC domain-containing protein n=1 Tax=Kribbella sp. NPDC023855 TaxID=3154698 RepID=UPI0033F5C810